MTESNLNGYSMRFTTGRLRAVTTKLHARTRQIAIQEALSRSILVLGISLEIIDDDTGEVVGSFIGGANRRGK